MIGKKDIDDDDHVGPENVLWQVRAGWDRCIGNAIEGNVTLARVIAGIPHGYCYVRAVRRAAEWRGPKMNAGHRNFNVEGPRKGRLLAGGVVQDAWEDQRGGVMIKLQVDIRHSSCG